MFWIRFATSRNALLAKTWMYDSLIIKQKFDSSYMKSCPQRGQIHFALCIMHFAFLSCDAVDCRVVGELEHQSVGQAYDLSAPVAEATGHAVPVGAVCFRNGHLTIPDRYSIFTPGRFYRNSPVHRKGQCVKHLAIGNNGYGAGSVSRPEQPKAQTNTDSYDRSGQEDPKFSFQQ